MASKAQKLQVAIEHNQRAYVKDVAEMVEAIESGDMETVALCRRDIAKWRKNLADLGAFPADPAADTDAMREARIRFSQALAPIAKEEGERAAREANAATPAQLDYLAKLGYVSDGSYLSKQDASRMIDARKNRSTITAEDNDDSEAFDTVRRSML